MPRVVITYDSDSMELLPGETVIGRGLSCQIRFNDPAVSRAHVRLIVDDESALVEDLGSTNGTLLNGESLSGSKPISDGDVVELGYRKLELQILAEEPEDPEAHEQTLNRDAHWLADTPTDQNPFSDEGAVGVSDELTVSQSGLPPVQNPVKHHCPRCRTSVPYADDVCPSCGYEWPAGRPTSNTQRIRLAELSRRTNRRQLVEIPVLYSSETLTFDAFARDLSPGGMFIATELLDPIGTPCTITVLPDGGAAVRLKAEVCHVVQTNTGEAGKPPGIGVKFGKLSPEGENWLEAAAG